MIKKPSKSTDSIYYICWLSAGGIVRKLVIRVSDHVGRTRKKGYHADIRSMEEMGEILRDFQENPKDYYFNNKTRRYICT